MKMSMDQNMGGGMVTMNMKMHMKISVKDIVNDIYDTEMKFTKVAINMNQGGMSMGFDTDTKDEDLDAQQKMMKSQMAPMMGMLIGAKYNNLGKIIEMKILEGAGAGMDEFKNASNSIEYPKEAVKVGTTWSEKKDNQGMKMNYTYKVSSITKEIVTLDVSGKVSGTGEGTLTGKMNIDRVTGLYKDSNIDMTMKVMGQDVKAKVTYTSEEI